MVRETTGYEICDFSCGKRYFHAALKTLRGLPTLDAEKKSIFMNFF